MKAYVLIVTEATETRVACNVIRRLPGVIEAHAVTGDYDIVAELDANNPAQLARIVREGIRRTAGVKSTTSLLVLVR
jgi:DNA-binding Lrp family transcriptional regulator